MKVNQVHLHSINKLFCVIHYLGLSLWKVCFICHCGIRFSNVGLIFSIIIVFVVTCAILSQHLKTIAGFDTVFHSSMSNIVRHIHRFVFHFHTFAVFVPIWIYRRKMRVIYQKFLLVHRIVADLDKEVAANFIFFRLAVSIFIRIIFVFIITVAITFFGTKIAKTHRSADTGKIVGINWETVFAYVVPPLLKHLCILHCMTLMHLTSTRMTQVRELLNKITYELYTIVIEAF